MLRNVTLTSLNIIELKPRDILLRHWLRILRHHGVPKRKLYHTMIRALRSLRRYHLRRAKFGCCRVRCSASCDLTILWRLVWSLLNLDAEATGADNAVRTCEIKMFENNYVKDGINSQDLANWRWWPQSRSEIDSIRREEYNKKSYRTFVGLLVLALAASGHFHISCRTAVLLRQWIR